MFAKSIQRVWAQKLSEDQIRNNAQFCYKLQKIHAEIDKMESYPLAYLAMYIDTFVKSRNTSKVLAKLSKYDDAQSLEELRMKVKTLISEIMERKLNSTEADIEIHGGVELMNIMNAMYKL